MWGLQAGGWLLVRNGVPVTPNYTILLDCMDGNPASGGHAFHRDVTVGLGNHLQYCSSEGDVLADDGQIIRSDI